MFQQLLASKHHRLRDSKFGRVKALVWSPTNRKKKPRVNHEPRSAHGRAVNKINHGQNMNRARPMAARLEKPRVNHEPRSAHGRAVNNFKTCQGTEGRCFLNNYKTKTEKE